MAIERNLIHPNLCTSTRCPLPKVLGIRSLDLRVQRKEKICGPPDSHHVAQEEFEQGQARQSDIIQVRGNL
ncbi:hypothetical protein ACI65C_008010 [Semiaphis heraclei]